MKTIVWVYVCVTLQGFTAILIHSFLKILVLPKIIVRTSFLLPFTYGPLFSTHTSTSIVRAIFIQFIQAEKLMSSLVISFRLPPDTLPMLLHVFVFPCRKCAFK